MADTPSDRTAVTMPQDARPLCVEPQIFEAVARARPAARLSLALGALGLLLIAAAVSFAAYFVHSLYNIELQSIRSRLQVPAQAVAHVVEAMARNVDLALLDVRATMQDGKAGQRYSLPELRERMLDRVYARSAAAKIEIYDRDGKAIVSTLSEPPPGVSVARYDFFKQQMAATTDQFLISRFVTDPLDGGPAIIASRPIFDASGTPLGVVAAYFDLQSLQGIFDSLSMPPGSAMTLFSHDGAHLLRSPKVMLGDKILGVDFSKRPAFRRFRDSGPLGDFGEFVTLASGAKRFIAGVGGPDSYFVVSAGWDTAAALAAWRSEATLIIGYTIAGTVVIGALFVYVLAGLRRNEVLLREVSRSEQKFRALMAALPDAVVIIDEMLRVTFANAAAEQLYGYEAGALNGIALAALLASSQPEWQREPRAVFKNWSLERRLLGLEFSAQRRDGSEFPVEINACPYDSPSGHVLVSVIRDITRRQESDLALRRSRENLARAQRVAGVGSFEVDFATGQRDWSDEFMRIWGITEQPAQDQTGFLAAMVHPEDRQKFADARAAVLAGEVHPLVDFRIIRPDGVERILHNEYRADFDAEGKPTRLFGTIQDITERKKIELELRRSRENLARAQRIAGIGSFERNLVTGALECSDELYRIHGVVPGTPEANIDFLRSLVHPDDHDRIEAFRRAAATGERVEAVDYRIIRPDGVERVLHRECDIAFDASGKPVHLFGTLQDVTERTAIEAELRHSRENLARAQRIAALGSFDHDLISHAVEWSDELYRLYGLKPGDAEVGPKRAVSFVHPDDREKFLSVTARAKRGEKTSALDFRITRADGVERILHRECDVTYDEAGRPIRISGTLQDVTEQKRAELELVRSRENLARAQQIANIGSFERDLITGELTWSDEFLRIWGLTERPTHGTAELLLARVHPEDRKRFVEGRDAALGRKDISSLDFRITLPDGSERTLHREYGVIFDKSGKPVRMFGTVQDITERKLIEVEVRRSRENLARAQRIAGMGSFERDLVTDRAEWSDEMFHLLGLEKRSVPSSAALIQTIHPEDRAKFLAHRAAELEGRAGTPLEYRIVRPDGTERIVRRETAVALDEAGRPVRLYGTMQDITERRLAERRERELERQLLHSQKLEALGTLAGGIAHDLNNTLVPIMALSKLTARRFESGSLVRANLDTIYQASERARDLVKRVVAFSRKDDAEKRDTDFAAVIGEALQLLRATIPSSICLDVQIRAVPLIPADASQIHQVVTNLVSNAAQAIGSDIGTITVILDTVPSAVGIDEIRLAVSDTGGGMDEATQQRIFEPFFTTKPVGQGTGLGLSIVHGIVAGHGGHIEVRSAPRKGTRFDLYFPVLATASGVTSSRPAA